ncbi:MAG: adenylate/guanylate cyclase domain-containing protein [Alphaproteobacteria bacterium]|nr:adenylate/guanylate cyclase domain-containing protein [Alphaproteobacteria bacterium]
MVEGDRTRRRLAAIVAADVAGYSRLVGADEEGTLARLKALRRELVDTRIAEHSGRIVKTTGDGLLLEFGSAVDAIRCVVDIQRAMATHESGLAENKRLQFRIGVNVGDIVIDGEDILGDGVNVAARLEQLAEPGGICVSARAYEDVRGRLDLDVQDIGEQHLKNIERPIRVYRVAVHAEGAALVQPALALPDKPSIAVLPFQNMSGDAEQDYFCDGLVEDVITALSRFHWLFVIARNSSFTYKGKSVDVKRVSRELGVRYVLEGSVRKSGQKVRITGQLIDGTTGAHLWADRFDGDLADVFDLQDKVAVSVVSTIEPKVQAAEIERARRKPADDLDAYDLYLRALPLWHTLTKDGISAAIDLLTRAIATNPKYAIALGRAAQLYCHRVGNGWSEDLDADRDEAVRLARSALEADRNDADAICLAGFAFAYFAADAELGINLLDRSLAMNANCAHTWMFSGHARVYIGDCETAIDHLSRAQRLSPMDPMSFQILMMTAFAHFCEGRLDQAIAFARRSLQENPVVSAYRVLAVSCALSGRMEEAKVAVDQALKLSPGYTIGNHLRGKYAVFQSPKIGRYVEGQRKAGFPE